jgi:hypothetical protein
MQSAKIASGDHSSSYLTDFGSNFFEVKRPGFKAVHLSNVEVKNKWTKELTIHIPSRGGAVG